MSAAQRFEEIDKEEGLVAEPEQGTTAKGKPDQPEEEKVTRTPTKFYSTVRLDDYRVPYAETDALHSFALIRTLRYPVDKLVLYNREGGLLPCEYEVCLAVTEDGKLNLVRFDDCISKRGIYDATLIHKAKNIQQQRAVLSPQAEAFGEAAAKTLEGKALNIPNNANLCILFDGYITPEVRQKINVDISGYNVRLSNGKESSWAYGF